MLLFWGLLSLIQIALLPGLILVRLFRNKHLGSLEKLAFSFGLSLLANFIGVFALASFHLYFRPLVLVIFAAEVLLAIWLYRDSFPTLETLSSELLGSLRKVIEPLSSATKSREQAWQELLRVGLYLLLLAGAVLSLAWAVRVFYANRLTVFSVWDTVVSWNPWAQGWFENQIPQLTRRYGQLVPANWSLSYLFMGSSDVQFFAKSFMPLFSFFVLLLMTVAGIEFRSYGFFLAAVLTQLMFKKFLGVHVYSGYVDPAVSFFSFAAIYCLIKASRLADKAAIKSFLWLGALMGAGAFCAKQPGLYVLLAYPLFAYFFVFRGNRLFKKTELYPVILYPFATALALSVPWYLYTELSIWFGQNKTEFAWILEEVHRGRNLWERFLFAAASLEEYVVLYAVALLSLLLVNRIFRWITLSIVLPYSVFWALYASYSHRNLALAMPALAVVSGIGFESLIQFSTNWLKKTRIRELSVVPVVLAILGVGLLVSLTVADQKLIELQASQQREILIRGLNKELYDYFEGGGKYGEILTDYPLVFLPGFEEWARDDSFAEYATYVSHREQYPNIMYLLMPRTAEDQIFNEVMGFVEDHRYKLIFDQNGYYLIQVR